MVNEGLFSQIINNSQSAQALMDGLFPRLGYLCFSEEGQEMWEEADKWRWNALYLPSRQALSEEESALYGALNAWHPAAVGLFKNSLAKFVEGGLASREEADLFQFLAKNKEQEEEMLSLGKAEEYCMWFEENHSWEMERTSENLQKAEWLLRREQRRQKSFWSRLIGGGNQEYIGVLQEKVERFLEKLDKLRQHPQPQLTIEEIKARKSLIIKDICHDYGVN